MDNNNNNNNNYNNEWMSVWMIWVKRWIPGYDLFPQLASVVFLLRWCVGNSLDLPSGAFRDADLGIKRTVTWLSAIMVRCCQLHSLPHFCPTVFFHLTVDGFVKLQALVGPEGPLSPFRPPTRIYLSASILLWGWESAYENLVLLMLKPWYQALSFSDLG